MYSLADLLLYTPETWLQLYESYNRQIWPAQGVAMLLLAVVVFALWRGKPGPARLAGAALGVCWLWTGLVFHWSYHTDINWIAGFYAVIFVLQGMLMFIAQLRSASSPPVHAGGIRALGLAAIVLLFPLAGLLDGRTMLQFDTFGTGPDTTALATGIWLWLAAPAARLWLAVVPLCWAVVAWASLSPMDMIEGGVLLVILAISTTLLVVGHRHPRNR